MQSHFRFMACVAFALTFASACGDTGPTSLSSAIVTFGVAGETFRVRLTTPEHLAAAQAAKSGDPARIPTGRIVVGTQVNSGWSWHLEDVTFAEAAIELCDGRPSDVEREGVAYGGGRFCPWTATVIRIDAIGEGPSSILGSRLLVND